MQAKLIDIAELERLAAAHDCALPIEQTEVWINYQRTIDGRAPWGCVAFYEDEEPVAVASFFDYETHGYHYLRTTHGPAWFAEPTQQQEEDMLEALRALAKAEGKNEAFARLAVKSNPSACQPVLSTVPYDHTVVIDTTGTDEEILARFKPRGRRDVRKALRESPVECADETEKATESFEEYYDVMRETGERDGFAPAPCSDYEDMIRILGPEHCRVYAGRLDGRVVTWSIVTLANGRAVRYYGASRNATMRAHVTDKLVYFECCDLSANKGVGAYDMMGVGSDFAPSIMGLNEFKTKFSKVVAEVAPDRDLPLKKTFYKALTAAKKIRNR